MEDNKPQSSVPNVSFEAVKTSMMQDKNGTNIKLTIHPNDVPAKYTKIGLDLVIWLLWSR